MGNGNTQNPTGTPGHWVRWTDLKKLHNFGTDSKSGGAKGKAEWAFLPFLEAYENEVVGH